MNETNTNNTENVSRGDYRIYEYLKEHPSVMIACVSAIIATASFAMNAVIFFVDYKYFSFWGFDIARGEYKNPNQIYILSASIVFVLTINIVQKYFGELFSTYLRRTEYIPVSKAILRDFKKTIRMINNTKKKRNSTRNAAQSTPKQNKNPEKGIGDVLPKIRQIRSTIRKENWNVIKELFAFLVPSGFLMILIGMLYFGAVGTAKLSFWICILISLLYPIFLVLLNFLLSYCFVRVPFNRKIKETAKNNPQELISMFNENNQTGKSPFSYRLKDMLNKDTIKDSKLGSHIVSIMMAVVVYFIVFSFSANSIQAARKEFPVCYIDKNLYVIVYQSSDTYYMNQAEIDCDHLTIDTRSHRIITSDDTIYTNIKFEDVTILRD